MSLVYNSVIDKVGLKFESYVSFLAIAKSWTYFRRIQRSRINFDAVNLSILQCLFMPIDLMWSLNENVQVLNVVDRSNLCEAISSPYQYDNLAESFICIAENEIGWCFQSVFDFMCLIDFSSDTELFAPKLNDNQVIFYSLHDRMSSKGLRFKIVDRSAVVIYKQNNSRNVDIENIAPPTYNVITSLDESVEIILPENNLNEISTSQMMTIMKPVHFNEPSSAATTIEKDTPITENIATLSKSLNKKSKSRKRPLNSNFNTVSIMQGFESPNSPSISEENQAKLRQLAGDCLKQSKKLETFLYLLNDCGWFLESPKWTNNWWRYEKAHFAPWSSNTNSSNVIPILGIDYFWDILDVAQYINNYGCVKIPDNCLSFTLKVNYDSYEWSAEVRLLELARLGHRADQIELFQNLLKESGWKIEKKPKAKLDSYLYFPKWMANEINCDNFTDYNINFDYFEDVENIDFYLKTYGNNATVKKRKCNPNSKSLGSPESSPDKSVTTSPEKSIGSNYELSSDANANDLQDKIRILMKDPSATFSEIWELLKEIGWMSIIERGGGFINIPPWTHEKILNNNRSVKEITGTFTLDTTSYEYNRDYFPINDDVVSYIKKYGFSRVDSNATPLNQNRVRYARQRLVYKNPTENVSKFVEVMTNKKKSSNKLITAKSKTALKNTSTKDTELQKKILKNIATINPTQCYVFPQIWPDLKELGWKCVQSNGTGDVYLPPWNTYDPNENGKYIVHKGNYKYDYFYKDDVQKYIETFGFEKREFNDSIEDENYAMRRREKVEPVTTQNIRVKASNSQNKRNLSKITKVNKESEIINISKAEDEYFESPYKQDDIEITESQLKQTEIKKLQNNILNNIKNTDKSKRYVFPEIWDDLKKLGWKSSNSDGAGTVYLPPWNKFNPVKSTVFNIVNGILNEDYFYKDDVQKYILTFGFNQKRSKVSQENILNENANKDEENSDSDDYYLAPVTNKRVRSSHKDKSTTEYDNLLSIAVDNLSPTKKNDNFSEFDLMSMHSMSSLESINNNAINDNPITVAINNLHFAGSKSKVLARENEIISVKQFLVRSIDIQESSILLLLGAPGQGKSFVLATAVTQLRKNSKFKDVIVMHIQGSSQPNESFFFLTLSENLGLPPTSNNMKQLVLKHFRNSQTKIIIEIDEIDYLSKPILIELMTLINNSSSQLIILGTSNNLSLLKEMREYTNRVESVVFPNYTNEELFNAIQLAAPNLFEKKALDFIVSKAKGTCGGDFRSLKEIAIKCLEKLKERINEKITSGLNSDTNYSQVDFKMAKELNGIGNARTQAYAAASMTVLISTLLISSENEFIPFDVIKNNVLNCSNENNLPALKTEEIRQQLELLCDEALLQASKKQKHGQESYKVMITAEEALKFENLSQIHRSLLEKKINCNKIHV